MAYLDDHPNPNLAQQRPRRDDPTGLIVVHTAESALDLIGEDTGAEGVARFISERDTYGSYHRLADSDSIVAVVEFPNAAYGDGTGSNDFAIHLSFACRAADWAYMDRKRRDLFIHNGAAAAADAADWLKRTYGITVPAVRVNRDESWTRPGFISHGERDPGRRTDPGPTFPWAEFLDTFAALTEDDMNPAQEKKLDEVLANTSAIAKELAKVQRQNAAIRSKVTKLVRKGNATRADLEDLQNAIDSQED